MFEVEAEARKKEIEQWKGTIKNLTWKGYKMSDTLISHPTEQAENHLQPHYDARPQEVEKFLKEYFESQLCLSDTESLEMRRNFQLMGLHCSKLQKRSSKKYMV